MKVHYFMTRLYADYDFLSNDCAITGYCVGIRIANSVGCCNEYKLAEYLFKRFSTERDAYEEARRMILEEAACIGASYSLIDHVE